ARDEDESARADRRGLATDGQLIGALKDEEQFFLAAMDVGGWAFAGFVSRQEDREGAAGGLGRGEDFHIEAEGLDRQRLGGRDDGRVPWEGFCTHSASSGW